MFCKRKNKVYEGNCKHWKSTQVWWIVTFMLCVLSYHCGSFLSSEVIYMYWFHSEIYVPAWVRTQPYSEYEQKLPFCCSLLFWFPTPPCSTAAKLPLLLASVLYQFLSLFIAIFYIFKNWYLLPRSQLRWPHKSVATGASAQNVSGLLFELYC